jgi:hypothetical protein
VGQHLQSGIKEDKHAEEDKQFHFAAAAFFASGATLGPAPMMRFLWGIGRGTVRFGSKTGRQRPVKRFRAIAATVALQAAPSVYEAEYCLLSRAAYILAPANWTN